MRVDDVLLLLGVRKAQCNPTRRLTTALLRRQLILLLQVVQERQSVPSECSLTSSYITLQTITAHARTVYDRRFFGFVQQSNSVILA